MPEDHVTRSEYDTRHSEMAARITAVEAQLSTRINTVEASMYVLRHDLEAKLDRMLDKMDVIRNESNTALGALKDDIYKTRLSVARYIISMGVSAILGSGGLFGLLNLFHLLK